MSRLANAWAEQGHEVTLVTIDRGDAPAYPLDESIQLLNLDLPGGPARHLLQGLFRNLRRVRRLRRALCRSKPDIVISFMDRPNVLTLLASRGLGVPVVVSERTDPTHYDLGPLWNRLRRWTYLSADTLVCQTDAVLAWFQQRIKVRGCVIPNPVWMPPAATPLDRPRPERLAGHVMVAVGRLDQGKGIDLLLEAFARVARGHPDWSLEILGKGPLLKQLQEQSKALNLQQVHFTGEVSDPFPVLRAADLFVLSSRHEGFPNALCEAMACGLPVVALNCSPGVAAIIRHNVDGVLVAAQDVSALAAALDRLMSDAPERDRLAARAPDVLVRFSPERVLQLWEGLFREVVAGGTRPRARLRAAAGEEKQEVR